MFRSALMFIGVSLGTALAACSPWSATSGKANTEATAQVKSNIGHSASNYRRPYGEAVPWNIPVRGLPRHPQSDLYASLLWRESTDRPGNFNLNFEDYTYPVYSARDAAYSLPVRSAWGGNLQGKEIPWHPDWKPATGSDGQVIIIDEATGREWNLFQVRPGGDDASITNGNLVPGDYRTRTSGYAPSPGIGIPYLAMLVRPEEIAAGRIEHALSMPTKNRSGLSYVSPATKLEHPSDLSGIPLGMRFALDVTEAEIQQWLSRQDAMSAATRRSALIIARALRDFGWFATDGAGSAHFQFEANVSAKQDWAALGLGRKSIGPGTLRVTCWTDLSPKTGST